MAFLKQGNNSIFLEIGDETKRKLVRPLVNKPICIWGHAFPSPEIAVQIPGGSIEKARLREYFFHVCTAIDRVGTGCVLHAAQDPAWQYLTQRDQTNKKGHRVDFPMRPHWLLPVWSYADTMIKVIRNSGQVFEGMDEWDTEGHDIRECDWQVWFKQLGNDKRNRTYKSQRMDSAKFEITITEEQIKAAWDEAKKEYAPLTPEKIREKMLVVTPEEATKKYLQARAEQTSFNPAQLTEGTQGASPFPPLASQPQLMAPPASPNTTVVTPSVATNPTVTLPPPPAQADVSAMLKGLSPEQLAQMATLLQAQQVAGHGPAASVGSSAPPAGGEVQRPLADSSPKVPATSAPPPTPTASTSHGGNPADYVLESGKYKGKKLGEVVQLDPKYLLFFRSTQSEQVKAIITAAIEAKPSMPPPVATAQPTPAPTQAAPPVQSAPAQNGAAPTPTSDGGDRRTVLVGECKALLTQIPEFKGKGMGDNMMPFLRAVSGGKFDYTEWTVPELEKLQEALTKKLADSQARTQQAAAAN